MAFDATTGPMAIGGPYQRALGASGSDRLESISRPYRCPVTLSNPLSLPNVISFSAWSADEGGKHLTLFWNYAPSKLRVFVAEETDAVHVLVIDATIQVPPAEGEHHGWGLVGHAEFSVELSQPIGRRPVVDATDGTARRRVASGAEFERRHHMKVQDRFAANKWRYDREQHSVTPQTSAQRRWQESGSVTVAALDRFATDETA